MKKYLFLLVALCGICGMALPTMAGNVGVIVDGVKMQDTGIIRNGRTLVPIRCISEGLGSVVNWNQAEQEVSISKPIVNIGSASGNLSAEYRTVSMKIGSTDVKVNGILAGSEDVAPQIINGRTMVPVRSVSEWMEAEVEWNDAEKTVYITKALNSSVSDAVFEKQMVQATENQVINDFLRKSDSEVAEMIKESESWYSEGDLNKEGVGFFYPTKYQKCGFYHYGSLTGMVGELIYETKAFDEKIKEKENVVETFDGIRVQYQSGCLYFKLDDLKQKNIID